MTPWIVTPPLIMALPRSWAAGGRGWAGCKCQGRVGWDAIRWHGLGIKMRMGWNGVRRMEMVQDVWASRQRFQPCCCLSWPQELACLGGLLAWVPSLPPPPSRPALLLPPSPSLAPLLIARLSTPIIFPFFPLSPLVLLTPSSPPTLPSHSSPPP